MIHGNWCNAVEAFGTKHTLDKKITNAEVQLEGINPSTLLAKAFTTKWDFIISPRDLGRDYDAILGMRFIRQFKLKIDMGQNAITVTAEDGAEISLTGEEEEEAENEERSISVIEHKEMQKQLKDEYEEEEKDRLHRAEEARKIWPDRIMTYEEYEEESRNQPGWSLAQIRLKDLRISSMMTDTTSKQDAKGGELPPKEQKIATKVVEELINNFKDVFTDELPHIDELNAEEKNKVNIKLKEDAQPKGQYGPRMTHEDTIEAGKIIEDLLKKGFIRPSRSPWGAPMFLVSKPDGSKRMVLDYRALNAATIRNRYPLPRTDELFDKLRRARYFSKIDLRTGYWQMKMADGSIEPTAFTSSHGHFEWLVLPMGLTNAPAEFMAMMQDAFRPQLNKSILVFLDDILIYSRTLEEHKQHIKEALVQLRTRKLYAKISKCSFFKQEVEFLGHYVGRNGIRMVEGKITAIENWPEPKTQTELQQFIGLAGFYRKFIEHFSKIATPLTDLCGTMKKKDGTRKPPKKPFVWEEEQREAFLKLKEAVSRAPCLAIADPTKEFIVHTDASGYATGAALMQKFEEGLRPIAFLSKKMNQAEMNYPVHEQELLAIVNALSTWRHYLGGRPFTVWTDHQSLQYIKSSTVESGRQLRWAARLAEFDFTIKYAPGEKNQVADAMSRAAAGGPPKEKKGEELLINSILRLCAVHTMGPLPVRIREAAKEDTQYRKWLVETPNEWKRHNGLLYKEGRPGSQEREQLIIPDNAILREWLLSCAHDALESAHRGGHRMYEWLAERVWWKGMREDTTRYAKSCELCQQNKPDLQGKQGMPMSIETPLRAFEVICVDFIGKLPITPQQNEYIMMVVDKLTRTAFYIPMKKSSATEVFHLLDRHVFAVFGAPRAIISDRDTRFTSHWWEGMWENMRAELKRSTAFRPQTDGSAERENRVCIEAVRAFVNEQQSNWDTLLPMLQRAHNSSWCTSTGETPDMLLMGRSIPSNLDAELEDDDAILKSAHPGPNELQAARDKAEKSARGIIQAAQARQRENSERGRRETEIKLGDKVWLSKKNITHDGIGIKKFQPIYTGPYEVIEMCGTNAAKLKLPEDAKIHPTFNLELLKKYIDGKQEFPNRPEAYEQQGPILMEDPEAGGPGDAIYEVSQIVGHRGTTNNRMYKVRWAGWPPDQDSWVTAEDCAGSTELIKEYEETVLEKMRRKRRGQNREMKRLENRMIQKIERLTIAAAKQISAPSAEEEERMRERSNKEEEERVRQATRDNVTKNAPLGTGRPPMGKKGEINMGPQRCYSDNANHQWCKLKTRHGGLCWIHRKKIDGLKIAKSKIKGAGKGLFAEKEFKRGEVVAKYTGDLVDTQLVRNAGQKGSSSYALEVTQKITIDAARTNTADGRMINDARNTEFENNVEFVADRRNKTATLKAVRDIKIGEEILVAYGNSYWPGGENADSEDENSDSSSDSSNDSDSSEFIASDTHSSDSDYENSSDERQQPFQRPQLAIKTTHELAARRRRAAERAKKRQQRRDQGSAFDNPIVIASLNTYRERQNIESIHSTIHINMLRAQQMEQSRSINNDDRRGPVDQQQTSSRSIATTTTTTTTKSKYIEKPIRSLRTSSSDHADSTADEVIEEIEESSPALSTTANKGTTKETKRQRSNAVADSSSKPQRKRLFAEVTTNEEAGEAEEELEEIEMISPEKTIKVVTKRGQRKPLVLKVKSRTTPTISSATSTTTITETKTSSSNEEEKRPWATVVRPSSRTGWNYDQPFEARNEYSQPRRFTQQQGNFTRRPLQSPPPMSEQRRQEIQLEFVSGLQVKRQRLDEEEEWRRQQEQQLREYQRQMNDMIARVKQVERENEALKGQVHAAAAAPHHYPSSAYYSYQQPYPPPLYQNQQQPLAPPVTFGQRIEPRLLAQARRVAPPEFECPVWWSGRWYESKWVDGADGNLVKLEIDRGHIRREFRTATSCARKNCDCCCTPWGHVGEWCYCEASTNPAHFGLCARCYLDFVGDVPGASAKQEASRYMDGCINPIFRERMNLQPL